MKVTQHTAIKERKTKHNISQRHITTLAVNDARVTSAVEVVQGDKVILDLQQFHRFSPLVCPTYGSFKINTYAFFVPYTSIWHHFYEYLNNSSDGSFDGVKEPLNVSIADLIGYFFNPFPTTPKEDLLVVTTSSKSDLQIATFATDSATDPTVTKYNFTAKGRLLWNNLEALGYGLPTYICNGANGTKYATYLNSKELSLFPLLALARVFYDYLFPAAYVTQSGFGSLFMDTLWEEFNSGSQTAVSGIIDRIMSLMINCYDRDFYTSLWSKPNQVASTGNLGQFSTVSQYPSAGNANNLKVGTINANSEDVTVSQSVNSYTTTLSAQTLRWLESIADFCMRNNIGGSRVREYLRSNYGFVPSDAKGDISQYLKCFTAKVNIQDVTNVAISFDNSTLGEMAGKASAGGQGTLKFEASTHGILLCLTTVVPAIGYVQGVAPLCRSIGSRFDLYNSQFDGVYMEAVPRKSLFSRYRSYEDVQKVPVESRNDVFGYCPSFTERYKIKRDILSGDFLFNSRNLGLDSYHTFRDVLYSRQNLALDAQFLAADNQTQRIFANMGATEQGDGYAQYDKIFSFMAFDITRYSNMKSLSDSLPMFDKSGKSQSVQYEGNQL